ncbi:CLUMA_CG002142, isoform A [Clunio marinus]|uniref:CLUMA_CG002142, isoform A n=1 Tax=Clunio marinus TaxID=568069 RepID=A0A1J1HK12_9DIPT|nr:CLUMA_CG002142, isoform A [Clunio marinus]
MDKAKVLDLCETKHEKLTECNLMLNFWTLLWSSCNEFLSTAFITHTDPKFYITCAAIKNRMERQHKMHIRFMNGHNVVLNSLANFQIHNE